MNEVWEDGNIRGVDVEEHLGSDHQAESEEDGDESDVAETDHDLMPATGPTLGEERQTPGGEDVGSIAKKRRTDSETTDGLDSLAD